MEKTPTSPTSNMSKRKKVSGFQIEPLAGHMPKPDRIRRLVPIFEGIVISFYRDCLPYITKAKQDG